MVETGGLVFWRRMLDRKGRAMILQRQTGVNPTVYTTVSVIGLPTKYRPDQLTGDIRQGDIEVRILNDQIVDADWPGPPRSRDSLIIDGRTFMILGTLALYDGVTLCAHWLWCRGG